MANDARTFMIFYFAITLLPFAIPVVYGATRLMSSLVLGMAAAIGSVTRRDQRPRPKQENTAPPAPAE
jgi:hypothetical protein